MKKWIAMFTMALALVHMPADAAKRLGGGKSMGQQSNQVTQREAAKPATPLLPPILRLRLRPTPQRLRQQQHLADLGRVCWEVWLLDSVLHGSRIRLVLVLSLVNS